MFYGNAPGSSEDLFLQGLFDSGEAKTIKALKAKIAACQAQGGTWNPETEICAVPQPYPFAISPYPYGFSSPFPTGFIGGGGGGHRHHRHGGHHGMESFDTMYLDGLADLGALGAVGPAQAKCIAGGGAWTGPEGKKTCVYTSSQVSGPSGTVVKRPVTRPADLVRGQMVRGQEKYQQPVPQAAPARGPAKTFKQSCFEKGKFWHNGMCFDEDPVKAARDKAKVAQDARQAQHLAAVKAKQDAQKAQKLARQAAQEKAKADHDAKIAAQKSDRDAKAATHAAKVAAQKADRAAKLAAQKADRGTRQQANQAAHEAQVAAQKAKHEQAKADRAAKIADRQLKRQPGIVPDVQPMPYPEGGVLPPGVTQVQVDRYNTCMTKQRRGFKIRCYAPPGYVLPPPIPQVQPPPDWYTTPPAWWTAMPPAGDSGTYQPPGGAPYYPPQPLPMLPPPGSGGMWDGSGGGGGGGGGGSGGGGGGGPMLDESGLVPRSEIEEGAGGGMPGPSMTELAANDECNPAFSATLPQEYEDQWGKMTVLQVFCAKPAQAMPVQAQPQANYGVTDFVPSQGGGGADPFMPYDETQGPIDSEVTGPFGTKSITSVEAGEIGGADPMGAGAGW